MPTIGSNLEWIRKSGMPGELEMGNELIAALHTWKNAAMNVRALEEEHYVLSWNNRLSVNDWLTRNEDLQNRLKSAQSAERLSRNKLIDTLAEATIL